MKKICVILLIIFASCKEKSIKLNFINEYTVKDSLLFDKTIIGGISGVDYYKGNYYMVVDDAVNPRILIGDISLKNDSIKSISFQKNIRLNDTVSQFYNQNTLDLESVFVNDKGINLVSEGSIRKGKNPSVFQIDIKGKFIKEFKIPEYFKANSTAKPKHNGVFESSSKSFDNKGFWVAMEAPLEADGEEPTFHKTQSPIRISYFDNVTGKVTKQFAYQLEKIDKQAKGKVNLNGVTAILEYEKNNFFVIERTYQSGYGSYGNVVRIFKATINEKSTNTLDIQSLKNQNYIPLKKELLLDFNAIQNKLTDKIIDNIEGITFGPQLSNGNQSLILVSDDNFQVYGRQLNQFILLEIINK